MKPSPAWHYRPAARLTSLTNLGRKFVFFFFQAEDGIRALYASAAHPRRVHPVHADALAGGKVRCDRQWRRLLLPRCSLHAALRLDLHLSCLLAFGFLRGTLHVQAEDPRRSASGDDLNHGMATGFAT